MKKIDISDILKKSVLEAKKNAGLLKEEEPAPAEPLAGTADSPEDKKVVGNLEIRPFDVFKDMPNIAVSGKSVQGAAQTSKVYGTKQVSKGSQYLEEIISRVRGSSTDPREIIQTFTEILGTKTAPGSFLPTFEPDKQGTKFSVDQLFGAVTLYRGLTEILEEQSAQSAGLSFEDFFARLISGQAYTVGAEGGIADVIIPTGENGERWSLKLIKKGTSVAGSIKGLAKGLSYSSGPTKVIYLVGEKNTEENNLGVRFFSFEVNRYNFFQLVGGLDIYSRPSDLLTLVDRYKPGNQPISSLPPEQAYQGNTHTVMTEAEEPEDKVSRSGSRIGQPVEFSGKNYEVKNEEAFQLIGKNVLNINRLIEQINDSTPFNYIEFLILAYTLSLSGQLSRAGAGRWPKGLDDKVKDMIVNIDYQKITNAFETYFKDQKDPAKTIAMIDPNKKKIKEILYLFSRTNKDENGNPTQDKGVSFAYVYENIQSVFEQLQLVNGKAKEEFTKDFTEVLQKNLGPEYVQAFQKSDFASLAYKNLVNPIPRQIWNELDAINRIVEKNSLSKEKDYKDVPKDFVNLNDPAQRGLYQDIEQTTKNQINNFWTAWTREKGAMPVSEAAVGDTQFSKSIPTLKAMGAAFNLDENWPGIILRKDLLYQNNQASVQNLKEYLVPVFREFYYMKEGLIAYFGKDIQDGMMLARNSNIKLGEVLQNPDFSKQASQLEESLEIDPIRAIIDSLFK
jgi:hypothetical protein